DSVMVDVGRIYRRTKGSHTDQRAHRANSCRKLGVITIKTCFGQRYSVATEYFTGNHQAGIATVTAPAPDCTASLVKTAAGTLDVLHITVNFQTFKVRTHDDVHHT